MEGSKTRAGRQPGDRQAELLAEETLKKAVDGERESEGGSR
jgi:hypothetical protein